MNMSIKEIKEIVKGKEPIPPGQNELSFGNKDKSFKTDLKEELSKSVQPSFSLHLRGQGMFIRRNVDKRIIFINILNGKNFTIDFGEPSDLVEELKNKIRDQENIPSNTYTLFYQGMTLFDNYTLASYGIMIGTNIHLIFKQKSNEPVNKINVDIFEENCIFEVQPSDKIIDLKDKIEKEKGIAISSQRIFFEGNELENNSTFEENKITNNNTLFLKKIL